MNDIVSLIVDISSGSVGAALVKIPREKSLSLHPTILKSYRVQAPISREISMVSIKKRILETTEVVIRRAFNEYVRIMTAMPEYGRDRLSHIHVFFGAPWQEAKSVMIHIDRDEPFNVTDKLLESIISKEENRFIDDSRVIVDSMILNLKLNGYSVKNPYQNNINRLACSLYLSSVDKQFMNSVEKKIHSIFHVLDLGMTASSLPLISIIRDRLPKNTDFLLANPTEEMTELIQFSHGTLENVLSFPSGIHSLARNMSKKTGGVLSAALSVTKLHLDDHNEPEWSSNIDSEIKSAKTVWKEQFEYICNELEKRAPLPKKIFVLGENYSTKLFNDSIPDKIQARLSVMQFNEESLKNSFTKESSLNDVVLMGETLFLTALEKRSTILV